MVRVSSAATGAAAGSAATAGAGAAAGAAEATTGVAITAGAAAGGTDAVDDFDAIVAFGDFEFGNAAFANEINQCFKFAKIHDVRSG